MTGCSKKQRLDPLCLLDAALRPRAPAARACAVLTAAGQGRCGWRWAPVGAAPPAQSRVSITLITAGPIRTMNSTGRMNTIIGTVRVAGRRAAFSSP
jgi:hypothetical protein